MENNRKGIIVDKRKATMQFIIAMIIIGVITYYAILSDFQPKVDTPLETKINFGTSYMIGKYSPYIIGGIILLITIFRNVIISIYEDIKKKIR